MGGGRNSLKILFKDVRAFPITVMITAVNNQSCLQIVQIKIDGDENLQATSFADGGFTILTPTDNSYQVILTTSGENSCTITETRMMWPGK